MITILRRRVASKIWIATLKVKVTANIMSALLLVYLKFDFTNMSRLHDI